MNLGNHVNADFNVLDLCVFNEEGSCSLNTEASLEENIKGLLPEAWNLNYFKLQEYFSSLILINNILTTESKHISSLSTYDISALNLNLTDNYIQYDLKRVCRLKDEFRDLLIKNYWDYRGRVGVNTIAIIDTETLSFSSVECGFLGQDMNTIEIDYSILIQRTHNREKNRVYSNLPVIVNLQDLKNKIPSLSHIETNEIIIENMSKIDNKTKIIFKKTIDENKQLKGITIIFPYEIKPTGRLLHSKDQVTLLEFFSQEQIRQLKNLPKDSKILFIDNEEESYMFDENGKPILLTISVLFRGVYIPALEFSVVLKDNTFYLESGRTTLEIASTIE